MGKENLTEKQKKQAAFVEKCKEKGKKAIPEVIALAAVSAYALMIGVDVMNDVFTKPVHTIAYDQALLFTTPLAVTFEAAKEVWKRP